MSLISSFYLVPFIPWENFSLQKSPDPTFSSALPLSLFSPIWLANDAVHFRCRGKSHLNLSRYRDCYQSLPCTFIQKEVQEEVERGFSEPSPELILQIESALIMLAHELNITPSPSTLFARWMWGASTANYSVIYVGLPRETSRAPRKPFIFHKFWDELILSIAMKPDMHTLYFSSTSSEHHHINPLAPFQTIFPLTLPHCLYLRHLKDRWRQQGLLTQIHNIHRRVRYELQIKGFISTVVRS